MKSSSLTGMYSTRMCDIVARLPFKKKTNNKNHFMGIMILPSYLLRSVVAQILRCDI